MGAKRETKLSAKDSGVTIGVRHSYGGFQRLMKHNRKTVGNMSVHGGIEETKTEQMHKHKQSTILAEPTSTSPSVAGFNSGKSNPFTKITMKNVFNGYKETNSNDSFAIGLTSSPKTDLIIEHGLVVLIGGFGADLQKYNKVFEEMYGYAVIRADNIESLTVSKFFNVNKYDGILLVMNRMKYTMKTMHHLFTKQLGLDDDNIAKKPKLVISIKNEFDDDDKDGAEEEESDGTVNLTDETDDLYQLFGIVETSSINFSKHFIDELMENYNELTNRSLVMLTSNIQQRIANKLYLHQFDPRMLLYKLQPTK